MALFKYEEPITDKHLTTASKAWATFRSNTPAHWHSLLCEDTTALPFLRDSIVRSLEEYPSDSNGLSRTAHQALTIISSGENRPEQIFIRNQEMEGQIFLGDSSFWQILHEFLESDPPLIELPEGQTLTLPSNQDQILTITSAGKAVLSGERDWLYITVLNQWIGGVHLSPDNS